MARGAGDRAAMLSAQERVARGALVRTVCASEGGARLAAAASGAASSAQHRSRSRWARCGATRTAMPSSPGGAWISRTRQSPGTRSPLRQSAPSGRQGGHRPGISPQPPMHLAEPPGTTPWGTEPMPNPGAESEVECDLNEQEQELDRRINYVHPCLPIEAPGGEDQRFPRQAVLAQALVADRQMVTHMQMHDSAGVLLEGQVVVFATGVRGGGGPVPRVKTGLGPGSGPPTAALFGHGNSRGLGAGPV